MKTFATAQMFRDDQGWIENLDLTISFQIPEIWTDVDLVPYVEKTGKNYKKLSNIEEYVLKQLESTDVRLRWYDSQWAWYDMNSLEAMVFVIDTFYSALDQCSRDGRKPFHVNIDDPKSKIKAYGDDWGPMIEKLSAVNTLTETKTQMESSMILDGLDRLNKLIIQTNELISELPYQSDDAQQKKIRKPRAKVEQEPQANSKELDMSRFNPAPQETKPLDLNALIPEMNEEYAIIRPN